MADVVYEQFIVQIKRSNLKERRSWVVSQFEKLALWDRHSCQNRSDKNV